MENVLAWGAAADGQLGLGGLDDPFITYPTRIQSLDGLRMKSLAAGDSHTLFLQNNGSVYSCGNNSRGQLGHELSERKPERLSAFDSIPASAIAAGRHHSLAITIAGDIFTWGDNTEGQLGHGTADSDRHAIPKLIKTLAAMRVVQIACGQFHSLALTNECRVYSWGSNSHGQLGRGSGVSTSTPELIASISSLPVRQIVAGGYHCFLLTISGALFGWGKNLFGQLGLNNTTDQNHPVLCKPLRNQRVKYVCCGEDHTAVLTQTGGVFTFGLGCHGQLGHSNYNNELLPMSVFELMGSTVTQLACGRHHTIVYTASRGRLYSFGLAGNGQLGTGSTDKSHNPCAVKCSFIAPLSPGVDAAMDTTEPQYVVRSIHCGGDQSYCLVTQDETGEPVDMRVTDDSTQVLQLTKRMAVNVQALNSTEHVPPDLADNIELIFGSIGCINASFLTQDDAHFGCTKHNHGVNMEAAFQCFELLKDSRNHAALRLVTVTLEDHLLPKLLKSVPPDIEALRIFLTLPLCHLFSTSSHKHTIAFPYADAVQQLNAPATSLLTIWWSQMKPSYFNNLISVFKGCVLDGLASKSLSNHPELYRCMQLLKILYSANELVTHVVPYTMFYIDEITERIDIQGDYVRWVQNLHKSQGGMSFCDYPFVFNGVAKTLLLQTDALIQKQMAVEQVTLQNFQSFFLPMNPANVCLVLCVSRENIVYDTLTQIMKQQNADLKKPLKVLFQNEDAMDAGGVKKEFFLLLMREIINPQYGMFTYHDESRLLWFTHQTFEDLSMFHLIGIICGLAIYNNTIIYLPFPLALFKRFLFRPVTLEDLRELMPSVGRGLQSLLDYEGNDVEETFNLTFAVTEEHYGEISTFDLTEDGSTTLVTKDNRESYVDLYVDYIFTKSVKGQLEAFCEGFHKVCGSRVMELFQPIELQAMVIGNEEYDWAVFEQNAEYKDLFYKGHPTIQMFWSVFHELTIDLKKKFLLFLTGSDRIPILGMKAVPIIIQSVRSGGSYFPVAHTCFNLLDLPVYEDIDTLRDKLLVSIQHTQGFTLV